MKTLDVHTWKQNIEQTQKDIQVCKSQFETIQHDIEKVIALEGIFTEKTANAIRLFYSTCHQPLLKLADETFHRYEKNTPTNGGRNLFLRIGNRWICATTIFRR